MKMFFILSFFITSYSFAADCGFDEFREFHDVPRVGYVKAAYTLNDCELLPGLYVAQKTWVQWYKNGQILSVSEIAKPWKANNKFDVKAGAAVFWHDNGSLSYLDRFLNDTEVASGVWAKAHGFHWNVSSAVNWDESGNITWVQVLAKPIRDNDGQVLAMECQSAKFLQTGEVIAGDLYGCRE